MNELERLSDVALAIFKEAEAKNRQAELRAWQTLHKVRAEAEDKANAPIKKQLSLWVDSFSIAEIDIKNEKKALIDEKFEVFKKWAKNEIESTWEYRGW